MNIKVVNRWIMLVAGITVLSMVSASAQNPPNNNAKKPSIDTRPVQIPAESSSTPANANAPSTPARPGARALSPDVSAAIKQLQTDREKYLKDVQALARLQNSASAEDRAAIREQMKVSLDRLREQQRVLQKEARERAGEIKNELATDLGRVVSGSQGEGRGR